MVTPLGRLPYAPSRLIAYLRFPPVGMRQKARLLAVLGKIARERQLHIAEPSSLAAFDHEDAVRWARREIGEEACNYLVRPAIEPFFYTHASEVSAGVARALLRHALSWRLMTPRDGTDALAKLLAARLDVRLSCRAFGLERAGGGVVVHHHGGSTRADAVIVAVPPRGALNLSPPVPECDLLDLRQAQRFEACLALFLGYRRPVQLPSPSTTVGGPGPHRLVGLTALSSGGAPGFVPPGREVLSILAMGRRSRALLFEDRKVMQQALVGDVKRDLGLDLPAPDWTHIACRDAATVVPTPGSLRRAAAFSRRRRTGVHFAGDWLSGASTIEGAVRTGRRAAADVADDLRRVRIRRRLWWGPR
jgi:protoporphyrinogen/coproporphyrinogen III oxidase